MNIENETIKALRRQLEQAEQNANFWRKAKEIAYRGGTVEEIMAIADGVDRRLAEQCLDQKERLFSTETIAIAGWKIDHLKKKLAAAIDKERERMKKRGLL